MMHPFALIWLAWDAWHLPLFVILPEGGVSSPT